MSESKKTAKTGWSTNAMVVSFGLGFVLSGAVLLADPSCNPPELESQPLGKPSPPLPPPEL